MIYYSNSTLTTPHLTFIGRWSPFHQGHIAIIQKKRVEKTGLPILIMVRDTTTDAYSASVRAHYIKQWMTQHDILGTIMIIPNVEGVYWGRGVGYVVELVDVDEDIKKISATDIRKSMEVQSEEWKKNVASVQSSYMLSGTVSKIMDSGIVIWLTGCPSSGKTTIASALNSVLKKQYPHIKTQLLDGDEIRTSPLGQHIGFSKKERAEHIRRMAFLANMLSQHGIVVLCAFVSPDRKIREEIRDKIGVNKFVEVFVDAPKSVRLARDTKGLYKKARNGQISNLTGYNASYEKPTEPDVICKTDTQSVEDCVQSILSTVFKL